MRPVPANLSLTCLFLRGCLPTAAAAPQAQLKAQARNKKPERRGCWLWVNAKTLEGALDPLFLAFSLCVSLAAIAAGIYTIIKSNSFNFTVNSWDDFTQVGGGMRYRGPACCVPWLAGFLLLYVFHSSMFCLSTSGWPMKPCRYA